MRAQNGRPQRSIRHALRSIRVGQLPDTSESSFPFPQFLPHYSHYRRFPFVGVNRFLPSCLGLSFFTAFCVAAAEEATCSLQPRLLQPPISLILALQPSSGPQSSCSLVISSICSSISFFNLYVSRVFRSFRIHINLKVLKKTQMHIKIIRLGAWERIGSTCIDEAGKDS